MNRGILRITVLLSALILFTSMIFAGSLKQHTEKSFQIASGGQVEVDLSFHDLEVEVVNGNRVNITVDLETSSDSSKAKKLLKAYTPVFKKQGNTVSVTSSREKRGPIFDFGFSGNAISGSVKILLPADVSLEVDSSSGRITIRGDLGKGDVELDLSSGSVDIRGAMRNLSIDSSSGSVNAIFSRKVEEVEIDLSSGKIVLDGSMRNLEIDSSSGSISARGLTNSVDIDSSSGSIHAEWRDTTPGMKVSVESSSGSIRLLFPNDTEIAGDADTSSGGIDTDFPGTYSDRKNHYQFSGRSGAIQLSADASSGGITVLKK